MMNHINKVELQGTVGNVKVSECYDGRGTKYVRLALAMNAVYERNGVTVVDTTWCNVLKFYGENDKAEIPAKGETWHVDGHIRMQRYTDTSGVERYAMEVVAKDLHKVE